ncbi:bifunctional acetate--CoA ligase family protein/GNAT family N-acetyltransferase [Rubritepida flocculans]|uniref:bifunctional acetate--CoA ligase family protein/GNAT family N-acetyltransferase n=1 Tax=Rubritepida flocculans TaxID=182403 RepID=UPI0004013DA2|nr:GNAT family N-acetyltransferase [Rubritepida flocculans]
MSLIMEARPGVGFRVAALFRPRAVLLLADPALPESALLARNLAAGGFQGRLMIEGMAHEGFGPAEDVPDLAVLSLPPPAQAEALQRLAARGCRAVVAPVAAPGLAEMARAAGVRALGERSFGIAVTEIGLNATLAHAPLRPGRLALMTQSASIARSVLDWAEAEGLGFSHVIGVGANDDIGFAAGLDWLARDARTGCVLLELRRIKNRREFVSAARATARTRPVLALRPGVRAEDPSGLGEAVMEALLRRAGVLSAGGLEDWLAAAETLARARPREGPGPGDRIAILANGRGVARLAADAALREGLRLAGEPLSLGPGEAERIAEALAPLLRGGEADAVVALHAPEEAAERPSAALLAALARLRGAPLLLAWMGEGAGRAGRAALAEAGLAAFATPEAAVRGAAHLLAERRNRAAAAELPPADILEVTPDRERVRALFAAVRAEGRLDLYEDEALSVLDAYGVPVVEGRRAATPAEAALAAHAMGPPLVLKARMLLAHKSEHGGVVLNLRESGAVREAAQEMEREIAARLPAARMDGFLLQRQAPRGALELRLRAGEDAMFGPWIGFGQGGTTADLARDEAVEMPPLNLPLAHALIARTRLSRLLPGWRDRPAVAEPAIADSLVRLSQLLVDFPEIASLAVNPLLATAAGVLAVDAELALRPAGEAALHAIAPYPAHLAERWTARDGRVFELRPIRPEDAAAQGAFFRALPAEDVRFRFFSTMKELPPPLLARLTQIDYAREMAFVAMREGRNHGTARVIREPLGNSAEFAVVVTPDAKGTGLARRLMERAEEWARSQGVSELVGHVLADNQPMLGFVRKLGYALRRSAEDAEVMLAVKRL